MSGQQADTTASSSERSREQAYAVLETLLRSGSDRGRAADDDARSRTRAELALRAALHPALRPALEDPLTTITGEYVSLDARVAPLAAPVLARLPARTLTQFPDADWSSLALVGVAPPALAASADDSLAVSRVGAIEGTLFVPALGAGVVCGIRVWVGANAAVASWERERLGWEPPRAVRPVGAAVAASAERALRAALLLLCADDALPPDLRPGLVLYDVCAPLSDEQMAGVEGDSLELPLALAFLSALTRRPLVSDVGATGALAIDETAERAVVRPVGAVPAKTAAFFASFGNEAQPCFLVPANESETKTGVITVATLRDAVEAAFADGLPTNREAPLLAAHEEGSPVALCACIVSEALPRVPALRAPIARLLRETLNKSGGKPDAAVLGDAAPERLIEAARFTMVHAATAAAERLLRTLRCYPWPRTLDDTLLPGIGVDAAGELGEDKTFGVGRAASIAESAAGGRILLSAEAVRAARATRAAARLTPLGTHRLCDLRPPLALLEWTEGQVAESSSSPALRQRLDDRPHNLPILATPLFGRDGAVDKLRTLLRASTAPPASADSPRRLITLTGVGGVGKSRLAIHVAASTAGAFEDGVWVVPVGAANSAEDVAIAVAETLRLALPGGTTEVVRVVGGALAGQHTLLVLDGVEESATGGAVATFLDALRDAAPSIVCLVTARAALRSADEILYPVPPLDVPGAADGETVRDAAPVSAAVALFCDCARRAHPGFALTGESDRRFVAAITRRLAGLPLAIELAAAPVGALTLAEIDRRLTVATTAAAMAEALRPASRAWSVLRQTIEWANALLDPADQTVLADLSVFADGFTATDAATICAHDGDREAVAESLLLLEQRSLIRRSASGDRFTLLQSVQDFARRRLEQTGRLDAVQARHARYFAGLAARDGAAGDSEREAEAFDRLNVEMGNLRAAVVFLRDADPGAIPPLVDALGIFLRQQGHPREWRVWPRLALRVLDPAAADYARLHARLTLFRGAGALDTGDLEEATVLLQAASQQAREHGEDRTVATISNLLGLARSRQQQWDLAQASHEEAHDRFRRIGDRQGEMAALSNLALLASRRGEKEAATEYYRAVVDLCRAIDDRRGLALAVVNLGVLALDAGDVALARSLFEESLRESRRLRDTRQTALAMLNLGDALQQAGDLEQGVPLLAVAHALLRPLRHAVGIAEAERLLALTEPIYGVARLDALRADLMRYSPSALLQIDPSRYASRTLRLNDGLNG